MVISKPEAELFAHLIRTNALSHSSVVDWAYAQYTDAGCPEPWIDDLAASSCSADAVAVLEETFGELRGLALEDRIGEAVFLLGTGVISVRQCVTRLMDSVCHDAEDHPLATLVYLADDYFDWHHNPEHEARSAIAPIVQQYLRPFAQKHARFVA
jgi:hypothetical protein